MQYCLAHFYQQSVIFTCTSECYFTKDKKLPWEKYYIQRPWDHIHKDSYILKTYKLDQWVKVFVIVKPFLVSAM